MKKIQISPSILAGDFSQLGSEIKKLEIGGADMIHVDVMDGHFVPNLTIGPPVIKALRKYTKLPFDVHLMISPVHKYIKNFSDAGSDIITIHPEATENLKDSIDLIKNLGKKVGISLNPDTPIDKIVKYLNEINLVLVMTVHPGFGGQKFISKILDKIKNLKKIKDEKNFDFKIEVDGGINFENNKLVIAAGADILVSGTTIFRDNNGDIKKYRITQNLIKMILKNSLNYLNEFFTFCLNQARQYYLSTKLYDKKISRVTSNNLEYKPSPSLLDCIIKYNKEKKY